MKNKYIAAILAVLFGTLGVHQFYLGQVWQGFLFIFFTLFFLLMGPLAYITMIISVLNGIVYLAYSTDKFNKG